MAEQLSLTEPPFVKFGVRFPDGVMPWVSADLEIAERIAQIFADLRPTLVWITPEHPGARWQEVADAPR